MSRIPAITARFTSAAATRRPYSRPTLRVVGGVGTFTVTFGTAGCQLLTATDSAISSITGTTGITGGDPITVSPAAATHLSVSVWSNPIKNSTFSFTVTALDQFNNTVPNYADTVHFTSTDTHAVLPADAVLANGIGTFNATFATVGSQTLTATDTAHFGISGSSSVTVIAGIPTSTALSVSTTSGPVGQAITLTATIEVVPPNTGTPNAGTVTFMDGSTAIGSAPVNVGTATLVVSSLTAGTHALLADYSGVGSGYGDSQSGVGANSLITTFAGDGAGGNSGDNGSALKATLNYPSDVAADTAGDVFVLDMYNDRVRTVNLATGMISAFAGNGTQGCTGNNSPATAAEFRLSSEGVAVDGSGNVFIADANNNRVCEVDHSTGMISTIAGTGTAGFGGDGGPATSALLNFPMGVAVDATGHYLYISDHNNRRVRCVDLTSHKITTVAGDGSLAPSSDGGLATATAIGLNAGIALDTSGNLFIADEYGVVREVNLLTDIITTVAGGGTSGLGDGGPATSASLSSPFGVAADAEGDLFIADQGHHRVREVNLATTIITTVAGTGTNGHNGDGGQAGAAEVSIPIGLAVDSQGDLFVADTGNNLIREVQPGCLVTIAQATNNTVVTCSVSPSYYGQSITFTATVAPSGSAVPTGTVQFKIDGSNVGSPQTLSGGVATYTTSTLAVGSHSVVAVYSGDTNFTNGTSPTFNETVSKATPTITWGTPAPIAYGTALSSTQLDASASVGGTYSYSAALGTVLQAGTQSLSATFTPTDTTDYTTATAAVTLNISPAVLTADVSIGNKCYDGTCAATITGLSLSGIIGSDEVSLTGGVAAFADENVGTGKIVNVAGLNLIGADAGNYMFIAAVGTASIAQEVQTIDSTQTLDSVEASSNVQVVIGLGGNLTVDNPVTLDSNGLVSVVDSGQVTLPGINSQAGATGIDLDNGTLNASADFSTTAPIAIGGGGGAIDANGHNVTLAGALTGSGGLTTTGSGSVILSGSNTYTGGTTISGSTLTVTTPGALPSSGLIMIGGGGRLVLGGGAGIGALLGISSPAASSDAATPSNTGTSNGAATSSDAAATSGVITSSDTALAVTVATTDGTTTASDATTPRDTATANDMVAGIAATASNATATPSEIAAPFAAATTSVAATPNAVVLQQAIASHDAVFSGLLPTTVVALRSPAVSVPTEAVHLAALAGFVAPSATLSKPTARVTLFHLPPKAPLASSFSAETQRTTASSIDAVSASPSASGVATIIAPKSVTSLGPAVTVHRGRVPLAPRMGRASLLPPLPTNDLRPDFRHR